MRQTAERATDREVGVLVKQRHAPARLRS